MMQSWRSLLTPFQENQSINHSIMNRTSSVSGVDMNGMPTTNVSPAAAASHHTPFFTPHQQVPPQQQPFLACDGMTPLERSMVQLKKEQLDLEKQRMEHEKKVAERHLDASERQLDITERLSSALQDANATNLTNANTINKQNDTINKLVHSFQRSKSAPRPSARRTSSGKDATPSCSRRSRSAPPTPAQRVLVRVTKQDHEFYDQKGIKAGAWVTFQDDTGKLLKLRIPKSDLKSPRRCRMIYPL